MKKIYLFFMILLCYQGYSQITLDFQTTLVHLTPIKLNTSQTVYLDQPYAWYLENQFSLYHLDGSFYKTIHLPPKPDTTASLEVLWWVTTSLFDNDPTNIEFLVGYNWGDTTGGNPTRRVEILRENGTILLDEPYAWGISAQVYNTEQGTKLMLEYYDNTTTEYQKKVFNLPGELPSSAENTITNENNGISIIPNPNNGSFSLNIDSKSGKLGSIELYTISGKLINTFHSNGNMTQISNMCLPNGMYLLNAQTTKGCQRTKLIIQK